MAVSIRRTETDDSFPLWSFGAPRMKASLDTKLVHHAVTGLSAARVYLSASVIIHIPAAYCSAKPCRPRARWCSLTPCKLRLGGDRFEASRQPIFERKQPTMGEVEEP